MGKTIITFLSPARENAPESKYETGISAFPVITGFQTNDASVKYFMYLNGGADKLICFKTAEAESAYGKLKDTIESEFKESKFHYPEVKDIPYEESASGINKALEELMSLTEDGDEIFLDITGGFRHANYLTMLMLKFADFTEKNINVCRVIYANFSLAPKRIIDITDIYKLFDLVNGAQNFASFGNSDLLKKCFSDNGTADDRVTALVNCMCEFSEAVMLCRTNALESIINRMNELITSIESSAPSDSKEEMFFRKIIGVIRTKFGMSSSGKVSYPDIIRWCAHNGLIQQALTLYVEKVPKFLLDKDTGIVTASDKVRKKAVKKFYDNDYVLFFEHFLGASDINDKYVKEKRAYIKDHTDLIAGSADAEEFFSKAGECAGDHTAELIKTIYMIKNCHYSETGPRFSDEEAKNNYSNESLDDLYITFSSWESRPGSFTKFIKSLSSCDSLIRVLHSSYLISEYAHNEAEEDESKKRKHSLLKKIYTIENLESVLRASKDFSTAVTDSKVLADFMRDYLYVKQYLRNQINHAADETSLDNDVLNYFRDHGYLVDDDKLTVSYITGLINDSVNKLQALVL